MGSNFIIAYSQFGAGVVLLLFAVLQLTYRKKSFLNINLAGVFFCVGFTILYRWLFTTGIITGSRYLLNFDIALTYLIGPFVLFYIRAATGLSDPSYRFWALNFIPAIAVEAVLSFMNISNSSFIEFYRSERSHLPVYSISPVFAGLDLLSNIHMSIYFTAAIWGLIPLVTAKKRKEIHELMILLVYMLLVSVAAVFMIAASILENSVMTAVSVYILVSLAIWYFLFCFRYPEFAQKAVREAKMVRYEKSPVDCEDAGAVLSRLDLLMKEEKLFADDELSLEKTSSLLGVTTHQLSRYINDRAGVNFRAYLNTFRIGEAKRLLIDEQDKTILEIAFMIGFNSKSSFNAVFMKSEGITPREFRAGFDKKPRSA